MAIRSQLRLVQLTGSLDDTVAAQAAIDASSLQGVLDQTAAAVKRLHGGGSFSGQAAGQFDQAIFPDSDARDLGKSTNEWGDLYMGDSKEILFGADQDVTLTHVPDTGLLINAGMALRFRDADLEVKSSADGQLDLAADAEIAATAPVIDLDASTAVRVSNDLELDSDAAVLKFGVDGDVSLTHVADTALLMNAGIDMQFRDADLSIGSDADGQLDLKADTEIEMTSPLVEMSGRARVGGHLEVDGNEISGSAGLNLTLGAAGLVTTAGDLQVNGNDIKGSDGSTAITISGTEVIVPGDLTVRGSTTSIDTTNLEVEDAIIGMNYTSGSAAGALADGGLLIGNSGGTQRAWYYDVDDSRWAAVETNSTPDATSIVGTAFLDVDVKDVHLQGLNLYGDGANPAVTLTTGDSPDVGVQNNMTMGDDNSIIFGADSDASIKYDEAASDKLQILAGGNGALMSVSAGDIVLGHSGVGAGPLGDVLKVQNSGGVGIVQVSGSIHSFGENLILSSSAGTELRHKSAADMMFLDVHKPASWSDADGIKLATNAASWSNFELAFGEVSILDAIVSAQGGAGTLQKRSVEVTGSGYPAGYTVPLALDLDALSVAEVSERVDVFVNGQLMVSGAEVSGNGDYLLAGAHNGSAVGTTFEFALVADDVVQAVVR
jgi:hypothetical protein